MMYIQVRNEAAAAAAASDETFVRHVENIPYFPLLKVDPSNEQTVIKVAQIITSYNNDATTVNNTDIERDIQGAKVTVITGGLTNALFKVDLPCNSTANDCNATPTTSYKYTSVLVRIFGAEGLINRDEETTNFARLCNPKPNGGDKVINLVHTKLNLIGRFNNGRVESWIPNMRQAHYITDFIGSTEKHNDGALVMEVARQLSRLHYGFDVKNIAIETSGDDNIEELRKQPTLWKVISSWIEELSQHLTTEKFQQHTNDDNTLIKLFSFAATNSSQPSQGKDVAQHIILSLTNELAWLKERVDSHYPNAPIVFCHNDVNAANILLDTTSCGDDERYDKDTVCIIDYEYGSINHAMYDIANFTCEHCGGNDNGIPNYELLPSDERLKKILVEYVNEQDEIRGESTTSSSQKKEEEISILMSQVKLFQMASNLYWGIWGCLQAADEVTDGTFQIDNDAMLRLEGKKDTTKWDNLRYGRNRLGRYYACKKGATC